MIAVDTSVIVAALQSWHERHAEARAGLDRALGADEEVVVPSNVLLESFSVMTRLPPPHRLDPDDAVTLLAKTLEGATRLVESPAGQLWSHLRDLAERRVVGGAVYDAAIIECSRQAGATKILTLNRRHFERLTPPGIEVVVPVAEE